MKIQKEINNDFKDKYNLTSQLIDFKFYPIRSFIAFIKNRRVENEI